MAAGSPRGPSPARRQWRRIEPAPPGPWLAKKGRRVPARDLELEVAGTAGHRRGCCTGVEQHQQLCPETQRAPACPWQPACLCSRDALRPWGDATPNPEAALAPLARRDAGELYISLLDPQGTRMLLAGVPVLRSRLHSMDVPQMVAGRGTRTRL